MQGVLHIAEHHFNRVLCKALWGENTLQSVISKKAASAPSPENSLDAEQHFLRVFSRIVLPGNSL
jgi:hypothetical protein